MQSGRGVAQRLPRCVATSPEAKEPRAARATWAGARDAGLPCSPRCHEEATTVPHGTLRSTPSPPFAGETAESISEDIQSHVSNWLSPRFDANTLDDAIRAKRAVRRPS